MTVRRTLVTDLQQPWARRSTAEARGGGDADGMPRDLGAVQAMAHTLITDLFGAGLRVNLLTARAPTHLQKELEGVAAQIDKVIGELRTFAFHHRA